MLQALRRSRARWGAATGAATAGIALLLAAGPAAGQEAIPRTPAPPDARVYVIDPAEGEVVHSPVTVRFGLSGMGVAPAGVRIPNTGHHHLILNAALPDLAKPLPSDEHHRHFGGGQTEVSLDLPPGKHTLQLVLADADHVPHDPPVVSEPVTIRVEPGGAP